jgi:Lrp/AsnC family leucine-responsive transcriptional regulator
VIERYAAMINPAALGLKQTVLVEVTLDKHGGDTMDAFARSVEAMPEVLEACMVAGECDFHLRVVTADTESYEYFLREKLYRAPGVSKVRSILVLRTLSTMAGRSG